MDNIRQYFSTLQLKSVTAERIQPPVDVSTMLAEDQLLALPLVM